MKNKIKVHDGIVGSLILISLLLAHYINYQWIFLAGAIALLMVVSAFPASARSTLPSIRSCRPVIRVNAVKLKRREGHKMSTNTIRLHHVLSITPEKLYRAFLEPDAIAKWIPRTSLL